MGRDIIETLAYSSFFWSLGTTSFRTKEFNYSIEKQLACLDDFWKIPEKQQPRLGEEVYGSRTS